MQITIDPRHAVQKPEAQVILDLLTERFSLALGHKPYIDEVVFDTESRVITVKFWTDTEFAYPGLRAVADAFHTTNIRVGAGEVETGYCSTCSETRGVVVLTIGGDWK